MAQYGVYEPEAEMDANNTIHEISVWFRGAVEVLKVNDLTVVLKEIYFTSRVPDSSVRLSSRVNTQYAFQILSRLQGVIINICHEHGIPYDIIEPKDWKDLMGITSRGIGTQKTEAIEYIEEALGCHADEDEIDAISMGYYYTIKNSNQKD